MRAVLRPDTADEELAAFERTMAATARSCRDMSDALERARKDGP